MKLLTFHTSKGLKLGVKNKKGVIDIAKALETWPVRDAIPETMEDLLAMGIDGANKLQAYLKNIECKINGEELLKEENLKLGPCVPKPGKIVGIGLNYYSYLKLSNTPKPSFPYIFTKFPSAVKATKEDIPIPFNSEQVDFEAELVIVMGKNARRVSPEEALSYVLGYCNTNDLSARELQNATPSWLPGKCCDGFCPIGPYLVTADEIEDPNDLKLCAFVNGKLCQDSNTSDMILNCKEIISGISQFFTLEPGDIILTGTPEGIISTWPEDEQEWLKDGDEVVVELEKLGRLVNIMRKEE